MRVVPYPGVLRLGQVGKPVVAVKRALWRAHVYPKLPAVPFTPVWGPFARRALQTFQQQHGLTATGLYGTPSHTKLAEFFDDYAIWLLGQAKPPAPKLDARRTKIVAACTLTYNHRGEIDYTQGPRRMEGVILRLKPPRFPRMMDCSSGATWLYYAAGAPDPNGRGFDGFGYTGTLARQGRQVTIATAKPGDLVFYDIYPYSHVTVYLGMGRCWSHGSSAGPYILPVAYRRDMREVRSYLP